MLFWVRQNSNRGGAERGHFIHKFAKFQSVHHFLWNWDLRHVSMYFRQIFTVRYAMAQFNNAKLSWSKFRWGHP